MPIISKVGGRSFSVRFAYAVIFAILGLGTVTMIYPLLLMLSGSVKSETDFLWITPFPEYLVNDDVLWMKYVESKMVVLPLAEAAYGREIGSWRTLRPPKIDEKLVAALRDFRARDNWPDHWYTLGHTAYQDTYANNARRFRAAARQRFNDNIVDMSRAFGLRYASWSQVGPPPVMPAERRFDFPKTAYYELYDEVKRSSAPADRVIINLDGEFWNAVLRHAWADIAQYNQAHGTNHQSYDQVRLSMVAPPPGPARDDWELYVRQLLNAAFIRIAPDALAHWRNFLRTRYAGDIQNLNLAWAGDANFAGFEQIPLIADVPRATPRQQSDLSAFLKDPAACPIEMLSVYGPRQAFEEYLLARNKDEAHSNSSFILHPSSLPIEQLDYADFSGSKTAWRWEFVQRNYIAVFEYLLLHGNAVRNTIIYCSLMIAATLIVNPLAAYALSRYKPPSTYTVLLFCMCTMAFPAEVTMIPSFLMLKRFPLFSLMVGIAAGLLAAVAIFRLRPNWPQWLSGVLGATVGIAAGYWLTPVLTAALLGRSESSVSLLNTFWALILPGMANGFSIFLLKGFFDSLPQELFEAADLDGASEWHKFWIITMSLSKPILAVLALGAFTAAYSEFMMALVIIPDQKMWTIMVWLFQLQQQVHPSVVYASLVVAAVPTFLIFVLCQNLIMRGIVVPVEK